MKNRKKQLNKLTKGFTLIELISVISIMAVLLLIAIPTYSTISNRSKENIYQAKVTELLAKAEGYSESSSVFVMDVNTLIKEGIMSPDNENGTLIDPRSNRKMNCDIIEVNYEDNAYKAHYIENNECLSGEELNNRYGKGYITAFDENNNEVARSSWVKTSFETFQFQFKKAEDMDSLESLTWSGDGDKTCTKEEFLDGTCVYTVSAEEIKTLTVRLNVTLKINDQLTTQSYDYNTLIDNQKPGVLRVNLNNDNYTSKLRKVDIDLTDYEGSGIKEFSYVNATSTCDSAEYESNKKETSETSQTLYLDNGDYYLCVKDKAGNMSDLNDNSKIHVEKVMTSGFTINVANSSGNAWTSNDVTLGVNWTIDNLDFCATKIDNESYERYNKTYEAKGFTYTPVFTGNQKKIVRFTCYDKAGNKSNEVTTNVMIDKDKPTIRYSVTNQTAGSNGYYKNITLKANVSDALSGISSIKYCEGENDCNPTTNATGSFNVKLSNGKNRKVCTIVTDKAGNSTGKVCSSAYNVDGVNPTISLSESSTAGENGWVKTASITGNLGDTISGLSSAKYCKNTYNCTPNTNVSISSNKINVGITNASNQKVCLNVTDNAGNTSSTVCSRNYYADNTAPTVSISASVSNSNVTVSANNAKDNLSGVVSYEYKLDNGSWNSSTSNKYTFTNVKDGTHTFYVRVKDKAGNYSSNSRATATIVSENPDDYNWSKTVACDVSKFKTAINNGKFASYIEHQAFRNAMYDCPTSASVISSSSKAQEALRKSSRFELVRTSGRTASSKCSQKCSTKEQNCWCNNDDFNVQDYDEKAYNYMGTAYSGKALIMEASAPKSPQSVFNTIPFSCEVGSWHEYSTYRGECVYSVDDDDYESYDNYAVICAGSKSSNDFTCMIQEYIDSSGYLELNGKNVKLNESGYATEFYSYHANVSANYVYQKTKVTTKKYDGEYYYFDNPEIYYTSTAVYLQIFKI